MVDGDPTCGSSLGRTPHTESSIARPGGIEIVSNLPTLVDQLVGANESLIVLFIAGHLVSCTVCTRNHPCYVVSCDDIETMYTFLADRMDDH